MVVGRVVPRMNPELAIAQLSENGRGTQVPACPCQRRIAMHVFGIDDCPRIKKKLNSLFGSKGGGSMQRRFTLRSAVAHEAICFDIGRRRAIRIGTVHQKHLENAVVRRAIGLAKGCVEGRLSRFWLRRVDISTVLDEELARKTSTKPTLHQVRHSRGCRPYGRMSQSESAGPPDTPPVGRLRNRRSDSS
jgi:hypothetical protein